ncbi:MAG TPA: hypothetical protein VG650_10550 [Mycobacteriales bacterium]|nr:hypothetical protein [Mycobacteriales bacterium]
MRLRTLAILSCAGALTPGALSPAAAVPSHPLHTVAPTQSDQTVKLHVGDRLKVHLGTSFRRPTSSDRTVIHRISHSGGYPTNEDARATFKALAPGRADISSTTDAACLHATPRCMIAQQIWVVHVIVKE